MLLLGCQVKGPAFFQGIPSGSGMQGAPGILVTSEVAVASRWIQELMGAAHPFSPLRTVPPHGVCVDTGSYGLLTAIS